MSSFENLFWDYLLEHYAGSLSIENFEVGFARAYDISTLYIRWIPPWSCDPDEFKATEQEIKKHLIEWGKGDATPPIILPEMYGNDL